MGQHAAKNGSTSSSAVVDMKNDVKIVFVGLDNSGKSSVFDRLRELDSGFVANKCGQNHTIGYNFARIQFAGLHLSVWDLAGLSNMRTLWKDYLTQAHAIVFVVDGADSQRLEEAKAAFQQVLVEEKGGVYNGNVNNSPVPMSPSSRTNSSASLNEMVNLERNGSSNNINGSLSRNNSSSNNIINLNAGSHNHHSAHHHASAKKHNMLILCNKQDKAESMKAEDIGKSFGIEKLKQKVKVVSCSATSAENNGLQDGLTWLMESLGKKCAKMQA